MKLCKIAYLQHEKHEAKKDPEHAHRHKLMEHGAEAAAVGGVGFAIHEHHEKKEAKHEYKDHHQLHHHYHH